jgi:hypothetical protein
MEGDDIDAEDRYCSILLNGTSNDMEDTPWNGDMFISGENA